MSSIKEVWGEDLARHLANINAKYKANEEAKKSRQQYEAYKAESRERIKKKFKDELSSVFSKLNAELQGAKFENDLELTAQIVHERVDEWCDVIGRMRKDESM